MWCSAVMNLSDDGDELLECMRKDHDEGLHHHINDGRDIWWYSDAWMPEVPTELLEKGGKP